MIPNRNIFLDVCVCVVYVSVCVCVYNERVWIYYSIQKIIKMISTQELNVLVIYKSNLHVHAIFSVRTTNV